MKPFEHDTVFTFCFKSLKYLLNNQKKKIVLLQANIRNTVFDQKSPQHLKWFLFIYFFLGGGLKNHVF